ncbi:acetate/propionate family kinase [Sporomusa sphaeroides]|uniref:Acetate kinase n=2 Tax=Sporomusa TaxID=2375 RepID=A0ABP2C2J8_9FIRM|nr:acetate kinase [Sporomusa sphaeroides]OLS58102.1 acetate kinase [Sporomusa sphaeroides DSM 2875]CVK17711.1 Acetate kinase [Sporomusa sphaeroides DSM 2875]SCM80519.1 Acetate kinase [uncultured Sporomusa sp.]HML31435.1 acetate kinase [Sporomusa sphaeroides]
MKVLVVNCGSSSIKYQLVNMNDESVLAKGLVERIGLDGSILTHQPEGKDKVVINADIKNHSIGIKLVIEALTDAKHGVITDMKEIAAVGHRVVHGGEKFADSVLITPAVMDALEECIEMAPLHNPPNIMGINACAEIMPGVPQVAVFDTAFHQTMPKHAFLYALPYEAYEKYGIRRYGFHGTSHKYVSQQAADLMGESITNLRIITCHLGNGASIAAVKHGKCIDTSMGFTPLEGLVMGTRCGGIDPAIIPFLMKKEGMTAEQIDSYLNKKSGVLGVSGVSSDFRDIENAANSGNDRSELALEMFAYRVRNFIGSYTAAMGGVDAIVFTAGLGENSISMREKICTGLEFLGTKIDPVKNNVRGKAQEISVDGAQVKIFVIPTNEELVIARDTKTICSKLA